MSVLQDFAQEVREVAEEVAQRTSPPPERYKVVRRKPLTLEAFSSGLRLTDGEDGFDVARGIRHHVKVDDTVLVGVDAHGDKVILGLMSPFSSTAGGEGGGGGGVRGGGVDEADEAAEAESGQQALELLKSQGIGMIVHGEDGEMQRGSDFAHYIWVGVTEPLNAIEFDQWIKPE